MKKPTDQQRNAERIPLTEPIDVSVDGFDAKITELSLIGARIEHFNRLSMGTSAGVQFTWKGKTIKLKGKVARTEMRAIRGKPGYLTGLNFADRLEEAPRELRWIMSTFVESIEPEAELAKPEPPPPPPPPPPPKAAPAPKPAPPPPPTPKAAPPPKPAPPPPVATKKPLATAPIQAMTTPAPFLSPLDEEIDELDGVDEVQPYVRCEYQQDGGWQKMPTDDPKQPISGFTMLAPDSEAEINDFCRTYEMADPDTQRMIRLSFELGIAQFRRK
jgi:PilZ domain-containing protein